MVLKISHLPSKLRFSAKCSFFGPLLTLGRYQPISLPPEGVYLLNILICLVEPFDLLGQPSHVNGQTFLVSELVVQKALYCEQSGY